MPTIEAIEPGIDHPKIKTRNHMQCYHCGTGCFSDAIALDDKIFCCDGCKLVYEILNENGLCDYYKIQSHPGLTQIKGIRSDKYAYLDNNDIALKLLKFTDGDYSIVTFYIPGVHCSSCMWLLEHLHKVNPAIVESRLNFTAKEVTIHFNRSKISLRKIVELLSTIGYEPYISLEEADNKTIKTFNKARIYKLGVAGFCFGNIMMMSFPEYLSHKTGIEQAYTHLFRYLNLTLSLPVFFYCASEFFTTAWKGIKQKTLNIDAPIALAILITFIRSIYEIGFNVSGGYLDSMSGIVFFMLVGRVVQERTYKSISFSRDYKSYFPIAVNVVTSEGIKSKMLYDLKEKDVVQLHNDEIIPADAIVLNGKPIIDYSFVTGESDPVTLKLNDQVYAGGRLVAEELTIQIIKPVAGSYLTSLWNHYAFAKNKAEVNDASSIIHLISKYFTWILLVLAALTAIYWGIHDASMIINSVTAMLIVACPCALLLTATFTNGNMMRIMSNNGLFLRDATVIEQLEKIDHIVFDKTGTVTQSTGSPVQCVGHQLSDDEKDLLFTIVNHSKHPYSKMLATWLGQRTIIPLLEWRETAGKGIRATGNGIDVIAGSAEFVGVEDISNKDDLATVYVKIGNNVTGFHLQSFFRADMPQVIPVLNRRYKLSVLSGDNDKQRNLLKDVFGASSELLFEQKPIDKLHYIESRQQLGERVMMIGDGLNDAGALQQSNVGITMADDINNFTPGCDAILEAKKTRSLPGLLRLARVSRTIINTSFVVSILYNLVGLYFSMQGLLKPISAAILMPCSTLSIVLITYGMSSITAKRFGLSLKNSN